MNWRRLEAEMEIILRAEGHDLDRHPKSGDLIVDLQQYTQNITAFAQELAARMKGEAE